MSSEKLDPQVGPLWPATGQDWRYAPQPAKAYGSAEGCLHKPFKSNYLRGQDDSLSPRERAGVRGSIFIAYGCDRLG